MLGYAEDPHLLTPPPSNKGELWVYPDPLLIIPPLLNRDYHEDPNIWALKGGRFINHGSTLT